MLNLSPRADGVRSKSPAPRHLTPLGEKHTHLTHLSDLQPEELGSIAESVGTRVTEDRESQFLAAIDSSCTDKVDLPPMPGTNTYSDTILDGTDRT